eukprot:scaffold9256_cov113-Isochrysis_galbana.AAC.4
MLVDSPLTAKAARGCGHAAGEGSPAGRMQACTTTGRRARAAHNLVVSAWPVPTYLACRCSSCECTAKRSWLVILLCDCPTQRSPGPRRGSACRWGLLAGGSKQSPRAGAGDWAASAHPRRRRGRHTIRQC